MSHENIINLMPIISYLIFFWHNFRLYFSLETKLILFYVLWNELFKVKICKTIDNLVDSQLTQVNG